MSKGCGFCPGFGAQRSFTIFSIQGSFPSLLILCSTNSGITCTFSEKPRPFNSFSNAEQKEFAAFSRSTLSFSKHFCKE